MNIRKIIFSLWRSTLGLYILNGLLIAAIYAVYQHNFATEFQSLVDPEKQILPQIGDSIYFQDDIDSAIEIFDFMRNQRIGAIQQENLFPPPKTVDASFCWTYPQKPDIRPKHGRWQLFSSDPEHPEAYLYGAYYDARPSPSIFPAASGLVQALVMVQRVLRGPLFCQLWFKDDLTPIVVRGTYREIWQRAWDPRNRFYTTWNVICPVPSTYFGRRQPPVEISFSASPCETAENLFPVMNEVPAAPRKATNISDSKVVVCVKGMDFLKDNSFRLIEWIELQYLMGADKIVLYTYYVHPATSKVIDYYKKKGRLLQVPLTLPGNGPNIPYVRSKFIWRNRQQKRRNEIVPYNDCLYRHLNSHDYVLIIDTDEAVVPRPPHTTWAHLLKHLRSIPTKDKNDWTAFSIRNAFFFDNLTKEVDPEVPKYMHMLLHNIRSMKISENGAYGKSFMYIPNVSTVFNHFPLHKQRDNLQKTIYVSPKLALKLHFKYDCPVESRDECAYLHARTIKDDSLEPFVNTLITNVKKVVSELGLHE